MVPFWWFDSEVRTIQDEAAPERRLERMQLLRLDDDRQRAVLDEALPTIDGDPEIVSLRAELDRARIALPKARGDVVCERDGTCGTRRQGKGDNYREKVALRDQLESDVNENLPRKIDDRTRIVQREIDDGRQAKAQAAHRRAEIEHDLNVPPPIWRGRWFAVNQAANRSWPATLAMVVVGGILYFALDVLVLRAVTRRICATRPERAKGATPSVPHPRHLDAGDADVTDWSPVADRR
jgi:hypothetical protein